MNELLTWGLFKPISSLFGGILIGISAVMLVFFKGRILGVSGIIGAIFQTQNTPKDHYSWRISFLIGVICSPLIGYYFNFMSTPIINTDYLTIIISGLLVGFGTRMGSGCTSGHAVCGIGRFSPRSLIATGMFMLSGFITAYIFYHLI